MKSGDASPLQSLRSRRWRWVAVLLWLAVVVVDLGLSFGARADPGPTEAEIRASLCHAGEAESGSLPAAFDAGHCQLCCLAAAGGMAPPVQAFIGMLPSPAGIGIGLAAPVAGPPDRTGHAVAPRGPPAIS